MKSKIRKKVKLAIFDLDNTLTTGTTIWELIHRQMGTWESHGLKYWDEFRQGKFGFNAFIRKDVACWKGMAFSKVEKAISQIEYIPKIKETITALKEEGASTALVSSSVGQFAQFVADKFGIDAVFANPVELRHGKLTGRVALEVPGLGKGRVTRALKKTMDLKKRELLALGDSVFDMPMFRESGVNVTFHDAPHEVKNYVDHVISREDLFELTSII